MNGLFRDNGAVSNSLKKWLKSPEGDLYTHITIACLSVVSICTVRISKIFSLQFFFIFLMFTFHRSLGINPLDMGIVKINNIH